MNPSCPSPLISSNVSTINILISLMFLQTSLISHLLSAITFITVPIISKTVRGTTFRLRRTGLTSQKLYQAFVATVKALVNFIWRMGYCAGKCFLFRYIETCPAPVALAYTRSCFRFRWVKFSSKKVTTKVFGALKRYHRSWMIKIRF